MFNQSLLPALCRETAAPPDSSASTHALTTPGSRPVSVARRDANCCWPVVSIVPVAAGSWAPVAPVDPLTALASADENVVAGVGVEAAALDAVAVVDVAAAGVNAVCRLATLAPICEIRDIAST